MEIFCNTMNVFTVTFDQFDVLDVLIEVLISLKNYNNLNSHVLFVKNVWF